MNDRCPRCGLEAPAGGLAACPVCLLADEPAELLGGSVELEEEIGRGGMGSVHRGRHIRLDRAVAVKLLAPPVASDAEFTRRFEREARTLARLNHPGIVSIYDFGQEGDRAYLVMELVDGPSLASLIPCPRERAIPLLLQICDALEYAHAQGVVHRDIKPENILVDSAGRAKLTDFGIARMLGTEARGWTVTRPDVIVGTLAYMAPEALTDVPPAPAQDIYSLGVVIYQLVMGRLPVGSFDPATGGLDRVVRRALAPDPTRRHASAAELRADLSGLHSLPLPVSGQIASVPTLNTLDPDEWTWLSTVALLLGVATAVCLWAALQCLTPRILSPSEIRPLVEVASRTLPDGRIMSMARFETWPVLAAVVSVALAMMAFSLLWRHWRTSGYIGTGSPGPLPETRQVLTISLVSVGLYLLHKLLDLFGWVTVSSYVPILGGCVLLGMVYLGWICVLQAWRLSRPVAQERRLWLALAVGVIPPTLEFLRFILNIHR